MKKMLLLASALALTSLPAFGSTLPTADQAWAELQTRDLLEYKAPDNYSEMSMRARREWSEQRAQLLREKGLAFYESFPADARRWSVAWKLVTQPPQFIKSYGPNVEKDYSDVVIDQPAAAAWKAKLAQLESAMNTAKDLPADVRESLDQRAVSQLLSPVFAASTKGEPVNWAPVTQGILDFAAKYPASEAPASIVRNAMYSFEMAHAPAESAALWRKFAVSPNAKLVEMAQGKIKGFEAISGPVDLAFTALDGRAVDTKKLRGKVVLIDFWAIWCGPCMAEMPNVKKVYQAYHDKGFEIIGIDCDIAPGQKAPAAAYIKSGDQVLEFTKKENMPWPHHYEGKKHNEGGNSLATRFAVTGIPAAFLLDQSGRVVAMNLRGEKLELEVKKLLGL